MHFDLPGKPRQKGNQKRAFVRGGRAIIVPGKGVAEAEASLKGMAYAQRPAGGPLDGPVVLDVVFQFAIPKSRAKKLRPGDPHVQRPDRGNLLKMIEDVLEGIAYLDDAQIVGGEVRKVWGVRDVTIATVRRAEHKAREAQKKEAE